MAAFRKSRTIPLSAPHLRVSRFDWTGGRQGPIFGPFRAWPPMGPPLLNGRYMTGKVLGVGGFGITYLGYDLTLEIKVAVKVKEILTLNARYPPSSYPPPVHEPLPCRLPD